MDFCYSLKLNTFMTYSLKSPWLGLKEYKPLWRVRVNWASMLCWVISSVSLQIHIWDPLISHFSRPGTMFVMTRGCQFMAQPLDSHWSTIKWILRYLSGTTIHGLMLVPATTSHQFTLRAYSGSDWERDQDDRSSTSGSYLFFGPNLVSRSFKKQSLVAQSNTEGRGGIKIVWVM